MYNLTEIDAKYKVGQFKAISIELKAKSEETYKFLESACSSLENDNIKYEIKEAKGLVVLYREVTQDLIDAHKAVVRQNRM